MCTAPPPPPPPVMPSIISLASLLKIEESQNTILDPDICKWAGCGNTELRESCFKYSICHLEPPFRFKYKHFDSIIQVGPTCGLVALSMIVNGEVSAEEMLNMSKLAGYTSNGEMLSCKNMVKLAEKTFSLAEVENVKCELKNGGLFSADTIERLLMGAVLLVPYDADFNHSPCQRNGHTAHWALVCGIIITRKPDNGFEYNPENVFVLCKHGKSKYLAIWNLSTLAKSNENLWEFSPKKDADGLVYIHPEGGIGGENGLRDQFLIFEGF